MEEIEDRSPLTGSRIDVAARIGWLLRTWRVARGVPLRTLTGLLPDDLTFSSSTLSRLETQGVRNGRVIAAYERALGLPYGHLRAPVDVLCRTFAYAPVDQDPFVPESSLAGFSEACRAIEGTPDGPDWLLFAEFHTGTDFGLPEDLVRPHVAGLASELGRSVGMSYQLRYEALARLRCSAYEGVVADITRRAVERPGAQRLNDLMSAVSERPTPELLSWCGELLSHPADPVAHAACLAIQNMRSVVGDLRTGHWLALAPAYADACRHHPDGPRGTILGATLATCEPFFRAEVARLLTTPPPVHRPMSWSPDDDHYEYAATLATQLGGDQPGRTMLTRLLFELIYDFRATHTVTAAFLLAASIYADPLHPLLGEVALHGPDEVTRHGAAYAFANLMLPHDRTDIGPWLASDDPVIASAGLVLAGHAGIRLPGHQLLRLLHDDGEQCWQALFAAGMAGHPLLAALARDRDASPEMRAAARWWLEEGPRVVDRPREPGTTAG